MLRGRHCQFSKGALSIYALGNGVREFQFLHVFIGTTVSGFHFIILVVKTPFLNHRAFDPLPASRFKKFPLHFIVKPFEPMEKLKILYIEQPISAQSHDIIM